MSNPSSSAVSSGQGDSADDGDGEKDGADNAEEDEAETGSEGTRDGESDSGEAGDDETGSSGKNSAQSGPNWDMVRIILQLENTFSYESLTHILSLCTYARVLTDAVLYAVLFFSCAPPVSMTFAMFIDMGISRLSLSHYRHSLRMVLVEASKTQPVRFHVVRPCSGIRCADASDCAKSKYNILWVGVGVLPASS